MARSAGLLVWGTLVVSLACSGGAEEAPSDEPKIDAAACELRRRQAADLYRSGLVAEAVAEFESAVDDHGCEDSLLGLALVYASAARDADAEQVYRRLLEVNPQHPIALLSVANAEFKVGQADRAVDLYLRAIDSDPENMLAHYHLGEVLAHDGNFDGAYKTYSKVLALRPANPREAEVYYDAIYQMGSIDIDRGDLDKAERKLERVLQDRPGHPHVHYTYGKLLLQLGRDEEAQKAFDTHMSQLAERETPGQTATNE